MQSSQSFKYISAFGVSRRFFTVAVIDSGKLSLFFINHLLRESKFINLLGRIQYKPIDKFHFTPFCFLTVLKAEINSCLFSSVSFFDRVSANSKIDQRFCISDSPLLSTK